jgi:hypothetical protein
VERLLEGIGAPFDPAKKVRSFEKSTESSRANSTAALKVMPFSLSPGANRVRGARLREGL